MRSDNRHLLLLSVLAASTACATPAVAQPDVSGVWQAYASVAEPGTGQAESQTGGGIE